MRSFLPRASLGLVLAASVATQAEAQTYSPPRQYAVPFVPMTGGMNVPLMGGFDPLDEGSGHVPIGFTFRYFGVDYTRANVSVNGFLTLAAPCNTQPMCETNERCNIPTHTCIRNDGTPHNPQFPPTTTLPPNRILAVFWTDLILRSVAPVSQLLYQTSGTAPSRVFTAEWRNIRHFGFVPQPESYVSFQIQLFEGSNLIRYAYGPFTRGTSDGSFVGGIELKSPNGMMVVAGQPCNASCNFMTLQNLTDQVIEFGAPNAPLLSGAVFPPVQRPRPGQMTSIRVRADNLGVVGTGSSFQTNVYLGSMTGTVSPIRDTLLGTVTFPSLDGLTSSTATLTAQIPAATMPGYYSLGALFDAGRAIPQPSRGQNLVVSPTRVLVGDIADFRIAIRSITSPRQSGDPFNVVLELRNLGAQVPQVGWELRLTRNLAVDPVGMRAAGGMHTITATGAVFTVTSTVPSIPPSQYTIIAIINPNNTIPSADPSMNRAVSATQMNLVGADLRALSVAGATTAFRGQPYTITFAIQNTALGRASNFYYAFYLSDSPLITVFAHQLQELGPISLQGGQRLMQSIDVMVPGNLDPRDYYLGLIVDTTNAVPLDMRGLTITRQLSSVRVRDPAPRFAVSAVDVQDTGIAGQSLMAQRTIENTGNAAGTAPYSIYLSRTRTFDPPRAIPIGMGMVTLNQGMQSTTVDRARIPGDTAPGTYYVAYLVDPDMTVDQLDRINNLRVSNMAVEVVASALAIRTRDLPIATIGTPYEIEFSAIGGTGPYVWSLASGMLPVGLSFDATGRLSGTPSVEGMSTFKVAVTDGYLSVEKQYSILVAAPTTSLQIVTRAVPPAFVGHPYDFPLIALGGVTPYSWIAQGELPRRIMLTPGGHLIGTATVAQSLIVNFKVTDATGRSTERPIAVRTVLENDAVHLATDTLPDGVINQPYSEALRAIRGLPPYVFSVGEGMLPDGLTIAVDPTAGDVRLSGEPKRVGTFNFQLRVTDARGDFDLNRYVVNIAEDAGVKFVTKALPAGTKDADYVDSMGVTVKLRAVSSATTTAVKFSVLPGTGTLPPGLMLEMDGRIRGKPTTAGVYTFTAVATDALNEMDLRAFGIVIDEPAQMKTTMSKSSSGCSCGVTAEEHGKGGLAGLGLLAMVGLLFFRGRAKKAASWIGGGAGILVSFAGASDARAQMSVYQNSTYTETYVHRSNGTRIVYTNDDDGQATIMLPFSFRFYNNTYNAVTMGTDGYVTFGNNGSSYPGFSLPAPGRQPDNLIAVFWDDQYTLNGTWQVEGTAPNRIMILQWGDIYRFANPGMHWEMQIWFYEGLAGRFELHFGPIISGSPPMTNISAVAGYENPGGTMGYMFLPCTFHCNSMDYVGLINHVWRATQDAGIHIVANAIGAPSSAFQGIPFTVTSSMSSGHGEPIGPFSYAIHLQRPNDMAPNNPIFTGGPVTLGPYQLRGIRDQITIPLTVDPGRYRLWLQLDPMHQIMDTDRSESVVRARGEIVIAERLPDFQVAGITIGSPSAAPGDMLPVTVRLRNGGNLDGSVPWKLYLSRTRIVTVDNLTLYSGMATLPLLTTATIAVSVPIPSNVMSGRYYVGAIVDPDNQTRELNKLNNTGVSSMTVAIGSSNVALLSTTLPGATLGVDYSTFLRATGGDGTYTFELTGGALPVGLVLDPNNGEIHGRPTVLGRTTFTVRATSGGQSGTGDVLLEVADIHGGLTIVTRDLIPGVLDQAYPPADPNQDPSTLQRIVAVGGVGPVMFSLGTPSSIPAGLTLEPDGFVHGVPKLASHFDIDVNATDGTTTVNRSIAMTVVELGRFTLVHTNPDDATVEEYYTYQLRTIGRLPTTTVTYSLVQDAGSLPDGLALTSLGQITGNPRKVGTWRFAIKAVEGSAMNAPSSTAHYVLRVLSKAMFMITPATLPNATIGQKYIATLEVTNGTPPFVWRTLGAQRLPPGLITEIVQRDGRETLRFTGTATAAPPSIDGVQVGGLVSFLVTVSDADGRRAQSEYSIRVVEPMVAKPMTTGPSASSSSGCGCTVSDKARSPDRDRGSAALLSAALVGMIAGVRRMRRRER